MDHYYPDGQPVGPAGRRPGGGNAAIRVRNRAQCAGLLRAGGSDNGTPPSGPKNPKTPGKPPGQGPGKQGPWPPQPPDPPK